MFHQIISMLLPSSLVVLVVLSSSSFPNLTNLSYSPRIRTGMDACEGVFASTAVSMLSILLVRAENKSRAGDCFFTAEAFNALSAAIAALLSLQLLLLRDGDGVIGDFTLSAQSVVVEPPSIPTATSSLVSFEVSTSRLWLTTSRKRPILRCVGNSSSSWSSSTSFSNTLPTPPFSALS